MGYVTVNFSNICDSALQYINEAFKAVFILAENERKPGNNMAVANYRANAETICKNVIYSCMSEKDRKRHGIDDYDVIALLTNIGVISGDFYRAKKNSQAKVRSFRAMIESSRRNIKCPIEHFLLLLQAFEKTGCITVNRVIGTVDRTKFQNESPNINPANILIRSKTLEYVEYDDFSPAVCDEIRNKGYKGSPLNPYSGGSFSRN